MNDTEKYLFDLNGYVIVEDVLSADEVARCNQAIDHHAEGIRERPGELSLSNDSTTLKGDHFTVENLTMQPKPVQSPRPPLWIGARVPAAVKRAVKYGDGARTCAGSTGRACTWSRPGTG